MCLEKLLKYPMPFVAVFFLLSICSIPAFAVAPVFETNRHIGEAQVWDFPGKWGPYPDPEAACRAEVWQPDWKGYPDKNYRGFAPSTQFTNSFECFCHSNPTGWCGLATPVCQGFSSNESSHADTTPFGTVWLSRWSANGCAPIEPDPLKPKGQCAGNPIDIGTGAKIQAEADISFVSGSSSYSIKRNYLFDKGSRPNGSTGHGWWLSFEVRLIYQDVLNHQYVTIYLPSGRGYRYEKINGQWQTSSHEGEKLTLLAPAQEGGNWTFEASGKKYIFNSQGYLLVESSPDSKITIERTSDNRIASMLFGSAPASVTYDSLGRIASISVANQYVDYGYDSQGRLISAASGSLPRSSTQSNVRQYLYEDTRFGFALTGITDETGERFATWAYDANARAVSSEHAGSKERVTLDYSNIDTSGASRVSVTNALGKKTTYHLSLINGMRKVMSVQGHASTNCAAANKSYDYYPNGTLKSKTDWSGNVTTYVRDNFGRETSRTEAAGTSSARTITTQYHSTLNVPIKITEPGLVTDMTYDTAGRLLTTKKTASAQ